MYVLEWRNVSALTRVLFWSIFPELQSNEGNKHQNDTRVSAETVHQESTYIILFLARHNEFINDNKTTILTHRPRVSLAQFSFCWWRHNQLQMASQWPDDCDKITWTMISNSLYIDFIQGDIHGRSCTKHVYLFLVNRFVVVKSLRYHFRLLAIVHYIYRVIVISFMEYIIYYTLTWRHCFN